MCDTLSPVYISLLQQNLKTAMKSLKTDLIYNYITIMLQEGSSNKWRTDILCWFIVSPAS